MTTKTPIRAKRVFRAFLGLPMKGFNVDFPIVQTRLIKELDRVGYDYLVYCLFSAQMSGATVEDLKRIITEKAYRHPLTVNPKYVQPRATVANWILTVAHEKYGSLVKPFLEEGLEGLSIMRDKLIESGVEDLYLEALTQALEAPHDNPKGYTPLEPWRYPDDYPEIATPSNPKVREWMKAKMRWREFELAIGNDRLVIYGAYRNAPKVSPFYYRMYLMKEGADPHDGFPILEVNFDDKEGLDRALDSYC